MPLVNSDGYWYYDTQGSRNETFVREHRAVSMVTRIKDWASDPHDYYLIEFKSVISLNLARIDKDVGPELMARIRDPEDHCYMILENFHEGFSNLISEIYEWVIDRYDIPPHKLILFSGALDLQDKFDTFISKTGREPFQYHSMLEFEFSVQSDWFGMIADKHGIYARNAGSDINPYGIDDQVANGKAKMPNVLQSKEYTKKYLNFNRRWRLHRPLMTALLESADLLKLGYVSLARSDDNRTWTTELDYIIQESSQYNEGIHRVLVNNRKKISEIGELTLDKPDLSINQAKLETSDDIDGMYEDTYFSLVSETIFFSDYLDWEDSCFLSEKIFKAILFRHPFVLCATPHTLKYLKAIGYKTYSPVIDESYDSIEDNWLRLVAILKEVNRLCKLEGDALEDYLKFCREIAEHNFQVLTHKKEFIYKHT
jgi:hypothetical protein